MHLFISLSCTLTTTFYSATFKVSLINRSVWQKKQLRARAPGTLDSNGVTCLFDPQAHTCVARIVYCTPFELICLNCDIDRNSTTTSHYWDLGSKMFEKIMAKHYEVCEKNWVCKRLSLDNIRVEKVSRVHKNQAGSRRRNGRGPNPMNVNSILNIDDELDA